MESLDVKNPKLRLLTEMWPLLVAVCIAAVFSLFAESASAAVLYEQSVVNEGFSNGGGEYQQDLSGDMTGTATYAAMWAYCGSSSGALPAVEYLGTANSSFGWLSGYAIMAGQTIAQSTWTPVYMQLSSGTGALGSVSYVSPTAVLNVDSTPCLWGRSSTDVLAGSRIKSSATKDLSFAFYDANPLAAVCGDDVCEDDEGWASCSADCVDWSASASVSANNVSLVYDLEITGVNAGYTDIVISNATQEVLIDGYYYSPGLPSAASGSYEISSVAAGSYYFDVVVRNGDDTVAESREYFDVDEFTDGTDTEIIFPREGYTYAYTDFNLGGIGQYPDGPFAFLVSSDITYREGFETMQIVWDVSTLGGVRCSGTESYNAHNTVVDPYVGGAVAWHDQCGVVTTDDYGDYALTAQLVYTGVATLAADVVNFTIGAEDLGVVDDVCDLDDTLSIFMCFIKRVVIGLVTPSAQKKNEFLALINSDLTSDGEFVDVRNILNAKAVTYAPSTVAGTINGLSVPSSGGVGYSLFRERLLQNAYVKDSLCALIYIFGLIIGVVAILKTVRRIAFKPA